MIRRRHLKVWRFLNVSREQKSLLNLTNVQWFCFYFAWIICDNCSVKPQFWRHSILSMNFNLQFNRECLKYKALKWRLEGAHFHRKSITFFKSIGKNYPSDFESAWYKKKLYYVQITCFPWHSLDRGEKYV